MSLREGTAASSRQPKSILSRVRMSDSHCSTEHIEDFQIPGDSWKDIARHLLTLLRSSTLSTRLAIGLQRTKVVACTTALGLWRSASSFLGDLISVVLPNIKPAGSMEARDIEICTEQIVCITTNCPRFKPGKYHGVLRSRNVF